MLHKIAKYPVQHPVLRKYINFFWELHIDNIQLDHLLIPQRNINMRFNLSDNPHYVSFQENEYLLEDVYFTGLQSHFLNTHLRLNGKVDVIGISFAPNGCYPFLKIPVSEFRNRVVGADEAGFKIARTINEKLKYAPDVAVRLGVLEKELLSLLNTSVETPAYFMYIFSALKNHDSVNIIDFCMKNNISIRQLERMYLKYVGLPASTYNNLTRFHKSVNQLLYADYYKLSDLAYDNEFYDQMHFIKEFRRFAGNTPGKFIKNNNSILQIGKIE